MKAVTLISILVSAVALSSCCCQTQQMPPLRPMPKNLVNDAPPAAHYVPVKVLNHKGK